MYLIIKNTYKSIIRKLTTVSVTRPQKYDSISDAIDDHLEKIRRYF